jgi:hypothetical protein
MKMKTVRDTVTVHTLDVWNYIANALKKTGFVGVIVDATAARILLSPSIKF